MRISKRMVLMTCAAGVWLFFGARAAAESPGIPQHAGCIGLTDCNHNGNDDACDISCNDYGLFCVDGYAILSAHCTWGGICGMSHDCNDNDIPDECDISQGTSQDCNDNGWPDECEPDCDGDGVPDDCEPDCDDDGIPDDCELDCDGDGVPDDCETDPETQDCDGDGICNICELDCDALGGLCDVPGCGTGTDCNENIFPDDCETTIVDCWPAGTGEICDGVFEATSEVFSPFDRRETRFFDIGIVPYASGPVTITVEVSADLDESDESVRLGINAWPPIEGASELFRYDGTHCAAPDPDVAEVVLTAEQWNGYVADDPETPRVGAATLMIRTNGPVSAPGDYWPENDWCSSSYVQVSVSYRTAFDCNENGMPDACDIAGPESEDCQPNGVPDECDIASGESWDCQPNEIPDECELAECTDLRICGDCDGDGWLNECETELAEQDCDGDGMCNGCELECGDPGGPCDVPECGQEADCNGNEIPDNCDIADCQPEETWCVDCQPDGIPDVCQLVGNDCDGNEVPDECDPNADGDPLPDACDACPDDPRKWWYAGFCGCGVPDWDVDQDYVMDRCADPVVGEGGRYVTITPQFDAAVPSVPVRLEVASGEFTCFTQYVKLDGSVPGFNLGRLVEADQADWLTPADWGTVYVSDEEIVPQTPYEVWYFDGASEQQLAYSPTYTRMWGDVSGGWQVFEWTPPNNLISQDDCQAVLAAFQHVDGAPALQWADLVGEPNQCIPDGMISLADVMACCDALNGIDYVTSTGCDNPCGSMSRGSASETATIDLAASRMFMRPGDTVDVDAYASGALSLRSYQVAVDASGGTAGGLIQDTLSIDPARDVLSPGGVTYIGTDHVGGRIVNVREVGGEAVADDTYLATFSFRASPAADGTFTFSVRLADTGLANADSERVDVVSTNGATVTVFKRIGGGGELE